MKISKNKMLLLAITLITVLILTTAVNATNTTDHNTPNTISEKTSTPANSEIKETTIKEKVKTSNKKMEEKTINKTDKTKKEKKTTTQTMEVTDSTSLINAFEQINSDTENDLYIINLGVGNYKPTSSTAYSSEKNIIIEGNNQLLTRNKKISWTFNFRNLTINNIECQMIENQGNLTLTNSTIHNLKNSETTSLTLINSSIDNNFLNNGNLTLIDTSVTSSNDENNGIIILKGRTIFDPTSFTNNGEIIDNRESLTDFENENITKDITIPITGNITLTQCNISAKITNQGKCDKQFSFPFINQYNTI